MSEVGLRMARQILREREVPFTERHGFSEFHYTALVFESEKLAWAAYDLLELKGTGPIFREHDGRAEIIFYG